LFTQWTFFVLVLISNAILAGVVAFLLYRRHSAPGRSAMIWMLVGLAIWAFAYAMITVSISLAQKVFWLRVENIGILIVPVFWFFFTMQYAQVDRWLTARTGALFFIVPVISMAFIFSDAWFHFYYASVHPLSETGGPLIIERGPWYLVAAIQSYLLNLVGIGVLIWRFVYYRNIYRKQLVILIGAVLIPLIANLFYQVAPKVLPSFSIQIDLTPIFFTITALLLSMGVLGLRLFDLIPIARHTILEHIPEMVFVVDAHDRVLDANTAAQKALGRSLDDIIGKDPIEVFHDWPQLINRFLTTEETHEEIQISGDPPRMLEIDISPLYNQLGMVEGRVIVAHDITEHKWLEKDLLFTNETLKNQLNEIERLRAELQEQAIRDPLTNVFNRRYMAEYLDKEISRAQREKTPISVVIMDIDHFKQFNDTYGHKCGDVVLQWFAKFLVDHTRRADVVCRYGGEEFVLLLPHAAFPDTYERADAWRQIFSETAIQYEGMDFFTTFSAGVASYPDHGATADVILQAADKALYRSKNSGRNMVTLYNPADET